MRAVVLEEPEAPLHVEEIPIPEPGPGEILVRVTACGACHTDLHVIKGEVAFPTPAVLGHEISGTVAALGAGVAGPPTGTPVVSAFIMPCGTCRHCARGRDDLCEPFFALNRLKGVLYDGTSRLRRSDGSTLAMYSMAGLADYAVVPASDVFPMPEALEPEAASILGCAVFTAYGAVRHAADVRMGERVAVVALGGVGSNVVALARAFGARQVIGIDMRADKLEAALAFGATDTVDASAVDAVEAVRELTDGQGVDVAFEALGRPQTFTQAANMLADGGRMVPIGIAPGTTVAPVEITRLVRRSQRIIGTYGARTRSDMPAVLDLAAQGVVDPTSMISRRVALEESDDIFKALDAGDVVGRAIVVM